MQLPLVAIVGAPNVGKSTLFNRLTGRRRAIVTNEPGVTRDRLFGEVRDAPRPFRLVDTGGLTLHTTAPFAGEIEAQASQALDEAVLVLFVIDVRAGSSALDLDIAAMLRRRGLAVLLLANKADGPAQDVAAAGLHELGFGEPLPVSAEHGRGVDGLVEAIDERLPAEAGSDTAAPKEGQDGRPLRIALVGRPNVGKSSLLNRLAGEERAVVSDIPGTTRDSIDTLLTLGGRRYRLIDTAGIRRRGRIERGVERYSVARAHDNIEQCDVAVLVLDATEPLAAQDAHVAGYVQDAYKPMVLAVNKWDLVEEREAAAKRWQDQVARRLRFVKQAPLVLLSAKTGQRATRVLEEADRLQAAAGIRVGTPQLNRWLREAAGAQSSAPAQGRSLRLYYATQTGAYPPRFVLFCNDPAKAHFSVRRYLENSLREYFGFGGTPLRLELRPRRSPRNSP